MYKRVISGYFLALKNLFCYFKAIKKAHEKEFLDFMVSENYLLENRFFLVAFWFLW